jgi:hypothetical protein
MPDLAQSTLSDPADVVAVNHGLGAVATSPRAAIRRSRNFTCTGQYPAVGTLGMAIREAIPLDLPVGTSRAIPRDHPACERALAAHGATGAAVVTLNLCSRVGGGGPP